MLVTAPFAGPVSFPILVAKENDKLDFDVKNSCETSEMGDVVLDSITNLPKLNLDYKLVAGVFIDMYSLIGNKSSKKIFTVRKGTLADYNARLLAILTNKEVINTTADNALSEAEKGSLALVGIEVKVGESFEKELERLNSKAASCMIYSNSEEIDNVLRAYEEGIRIIRDDPKNSAKIISKLSKYYTVEVMEKIIGIYNHRLTLDKKELEKSINVYSKVLQEIGKLKI
jgi:hypothetical protein